MNQNGDGSGFWTHVCSWATALFSAIGFTTEQWIYVMCALFGALLSLLTYASKLRSDKIRATQDEARTEILRSYLAGRQDNSPIKVSSVAGEVKEIMDKAAQ